MTEIYKVQHSTILTLIGTPIRIDQGGQRPQFEDAPISAYISSDGSKWVDFMVNGGAYVYFFSRNVVRCCEQSGINGIHFNPVNLTRSENKKLSIEGAPQLFWGGVTGGIEAEKLAGEGSEFLPRYKLNPEKWDGSDVFYMSNQSATSMFCSQKFKNMVDKHKLKGFSFRPLHPSYVL